MVERRRTTWLLATFVIAAVAFAARLMPVIRGGGPFGLGNYDDGVYYGAAVALVHGRLPYRDFLFLHPPGIVLALAPFAAIGRLLGDPRGFAVARIAWMLLGAANAVLVTRILRPRGLFAAVLGGLFYAVYYPAIYSEHTTLLEAPETTCLLAGLLLLSVPRESRWPPVLTAGALLGISAGFKIWGVVAVLLVAGWLASAAGIRRAWWLLVGAAAGAVAVCLPFFVAAPGVMWRMVVTDQVARPSMTSSAWIRMSYVLGLGNLRLRAPTPVLFATLAAFLLAAAAAWTLRQARCAVVLLLGLTTLLLVLPTFFAHYAALVSGPAAVTIGAGLGQVVRRLRARQPALGLVVGGCLLGLVAIYTMPQAGKELNEPFRGRTLGAAAASAPGCVTSDDPAALIEMDVLGRNLKRGCRVIVDLGGYSNDQPPKPYVSRGLDPRWQRFALSYLESGSYAIVVRYSLGKGLSSSTVDRIKSWQVVRRAGQHALRRPGPPFGR